VADQWRASARAGFVMRTPCVRGGPAARWAWDRREFLVRHIIPNVFFFGVVITLSGAHRAAIIL